MLPKKTTRKTEEAEGKKDGNNGEKKKATIGSSTDIPPPIGSSTFGVRSYLHQFYESMAIRNPDDFEEFSSGKGGRGRWWVSVAWRVGTWVGATLLLLGALAILIGYLVPAREIIVHVHGTEDVIDRGAEKYNHQLDVVKLAGLVVFCAGGALLTISLILPTFCSASCGSLEEEMAAPGMFGPKEGEICPVIEEGEDEDAEPPRSPTDVQVPVTESTKCVQPKRSGKEAVMTSGEGAVRMKE